MTALRALAAIALVLLPPAGAVAADRTEWCTAHPLERRAPSCDDAGCAIPLCAGERAPFHGTLLDEQLAPILSSAAAAMVEKLEADLARERGLCRIVESTSRKMIATRDARIEALEAIAAAADARVVEATKPPPFYVEPVFVAGVTLAVAGGLVGLGLYLAP